MNLYKQTKSLIPNSVKYPFWFLFKSPQRALSSTALFNDLKGICIYLYFLLFPKKKLVPVSVCTGIYNRSDNYINQLLRSLNQADHKHLIELSVFDCGSDDVSSLHDDIRKNWPGKLVFTREPVKFSRSYAFNRAVRQASGSKVFICDADMSVPKNIVRLCNQFTAPKRVWYPIYFFLYKNKPVRVSRQNGFWEQYASKGMFAVLKDDFIAIGELNEKYTVWGEEDTELWERFHKAGFTVIRNRQQHFFHHWHHTFNPKYQHLNE